MSVNELGDGQDKLRLILKTKIDMSSDVPTVVEMYMWNPSNVNDPLLNANKDETWTATILAGSETDGKIYYDLTVNTPMARGTWSARAVLTYSDDRVVYCKMIKIVVGN